MSNRTRAQPQEIYKKLSGQIGKLQSQIFEFNHTDRAASDRLKMEKNVTGQNQPSLKLKNLT